MSLDIHVSMNDEALAPFRAAWEGASDAAQGQQGLLQSAREHHQQIDCGDVAPFLHAHLAAIGDVIRFLDDRRWNADHSMRRDLQGALAYFIDPLDLIPDDHSRFGLLDDAIVLELALSEHASEWTAWREFDSFRRDYPQFAAINRDDWMQLRRDELDLALRHRRRGQRFERRSYSSATPLDRFVVH